MRPNGFQVGDHLLHRQGEVPRGALALSDEEGPVVPLLVQHLLCFGPRDLPEEPPGGESGSEMRESDFRASCLVSVCEEDVVSGGPLTETVHKSK